MNNVAPWPTHHHLALASLLALLACVVALLPGVARAEGAMQCAESRREGNVVVVDCVPGFASPHDRVMIYSRPGSPMAGQAGVLDTANAVWLFFPDSTRDTKLLIDFHPGSQGLTADIYDVRGRDGRVSYRMINGVPHVESQSPTLTVRTRDGWWQRGDVVSYNLDISVFGDVIAAWGAQNLMGTLAHGAKPTFQLRVDDTLHSGKPQSEVIQVAPHLGLDTGEYIRTVVSKNVTDSEYPVAGAVLWPYLGSGRNLEGHTSIMAYYDATHEWPCSVVKAHRTSPPPISVAWNEGKIICVNEFVTARANSHNWTSYSILRQEGEQSPQADFETWGMYALRGTDDGVPDLIVQAVNYPASDPYKPVRSDAPLNEIRYSWQQNASDEERDAPHPNFKIGLEGRHAVATTTEVPGLKLKAVPYEELPRWVTDNTWGAATFVAVEGAQYSSSEGIYELESVEAREYVSGVSRSTTLPGALRTLRTGLRGEYWIGEPKQPWLYLSPIDHKLHLLHVKEGVWTIDEASQLHYQSLGGTYVDRWEIVRGDDTVATLQQAADQLLLIDEKGLHVKAQAAAGAVFTTLPPTDRASWRALGENLQRNRSDVSATDLKAMWDQFAAPAFHVPGASVRQFRLTDEGFRFVLVLSSPLEGGVATPLKVQGPGWYVVEYRQGQGYEVEPVRGAEITASRAPGPEGIGAEYTPFTLRVRLKNESNQDLENVEAVFTVQHSLGGGREVVASKPAPLLAGEEREFSAAWVPLAPGRWDVGMATWAGQAVLRWAIEVSPAPNLGPRQVLAAEHMGPRTWVLGILLLAIGGLAGGTAWHVLAPGPGGWLRSEAGGTAGRAVHTEEARAMEEAP